MWPPSSGSNGSRFRSASERLRSPSTQKYVCAPCLSASEEPSTIPTGLDTSLRCPRTRRVSDAPISLVITPVRRRDCQAAVGTDSLGSACGRAGPSWISCPPRRTVIVIGRPRELSMSDGISAALFTSTPFTLMILSPGLMPIRAAG